MQDGTVYLEKADGSSIHIELDSLSEQDRNFAKSICRGPGESRLSTPGLRKQASQGLTGEQDNASASESTQPKLAGAGLNKGSSGLLSDEEIAAMVTQTTDERNGDQVKFQSWFQRKSLTAQNDSDAIRKYAKSGRVPYRVAAKLEEIIDGKTKRDQGTRCHFYIIDSEGKILVKRSLPLSSMCSGFYDQDGGYCDEVPAEGRYTAVIWVTLAGTSYGNKIEVDLKAFQ